MNRLEPDYDWHDEHCCLDEPERCGTKHPYEDGCLGRHTDEEIAAAEGDDDDE